MTTDNRFYVETFNAALGSQARSRAIDAQFVLLQTAAYLIQQELDNLQAITGNITSLGGFPASFTGSALKFLRVNAGATAVEFVSGGNVTIKAVGGTSYTLEATDAGALLLFTSGDPVTVTVPDDVFAQGDIVYARQKGAGQVTFVAGSGVTLTSSDDLFSTRTQDAAVALVFDDIDDACLMGERNAPTLGFASLAGGNVFTGAQTVTPVALTDGASIATNASLGNHFTVTLGGNRTLANPTNMQNGVILNWKIKQDGTGSRTLAYGSKFKWAGGTAPTLTTTSSRTDYISAQYFSDDDILVCSIIKDVR